MLVAAVAYQHMLPQARERALALLELNPQYAQWTAGVPPSEQARAAFLLAATWADDIKSQPNYINDGERADGRMAAANLGYADRMQHRYWHFIDLPFSDDGTRTEQPLKPNVVTQIATFATTLASPKSDAQLKSYDLTWLLHLVGDIHQPLHAISRFTRAEPQGDHGGNRISLCRLPCRKDLHGYWDDLLGHGKSPASAIRRAAGLPAANPSAVAIRDAAAWAQESFALAVKAVYVAPIGEGAGPYEPDTAYRARARQVAAERIELAGERLAVLLNEALVSRPVN
jgi:hypothetical protein